MEFVAEKCPCFLLVCLVSYLFDDPIRIYIYIFVFFVFSFESSWLGALEQA
uniref:Uncharacterized protein n=1 Tax=Oryza brachyantha TaxID=4533 RepID=J3NEF7_ORYBR